VGVVCALIQVFGLVLIARILLEWLALPDDHAMTRVRAVLRRITDPVLTPIRRVIPPIRVGGAGIDLSPLVVFVGLGLVGAAIC